MHFASVLIFCIGFFFGFHGAVGNDADHIVPHGGKTAVHHGVKHGLAVQQCVRRAVASASTARKMAAMKADLAAPVSGLIIADREVYAVAVNVNGLAVRRENNELNAVRWNRSFFRSCRYPTLSAALGVHVLNGTCHEEVLLRDVVAVAAENGFKALDRVLNVHELAGHAGEALRHMERLGHKALHAARTETVFRSSGESSSMPRMAMISCSSL